MKNLKEEGEVQGVGPSDQSCGEVFNERIWDLVPGLWSFIEWTEIPTYRRFPQD